MTIIQLPAGTQKSTLMLSLWLAAAAGAPLRAQAPLAPEPAHNPLIYADVPDMSMIRVGKTYYMSSTTMHMSPGVPIMKSTDLVNWQLVSYAYQTLGSPDAMTLTNGKSTYGRGSWASSLRLHNGTYYVSTFAQTTGKTYIYSTKDIEKGPWKAVSFQPSYHDHSLFFDDDGRVYMVYGAGKLRLLELTADASGIKPGTTAAENEELKKAKRRIRLLEQENEVLRRAAAYLSQANLPGK